MATVVFIPADLSSYSVYKIAVMRRALSFKPTIYSVVTPCRLLSVTQEVKYSVYHIDRSDEEYQSEHDLIISLTTNHYQSTTSTGYW